MKEISFFSNAIGDLGLSAISGALKVNEILVVLILVSNAFGDLVTIPLSEAIKLNKTLIFFIISENKLEIEGIKAISETLKEVESH